MRSEIILMCNWAYCLQLVKTFLMFSERVVNDSMIVLQSFLGRRVKKYRSAFSKMVCVFYACC